jgi:hypothetical protein
MYQSQSEFESIEESPSPSLMLGTPAPQALSSSPTLAPSMTQLPSSAPSSSNPTFSPIVRMQANVLVTLGKVPERVMTKSEVKMFTDLTMEFLQKYTEQTLILDDIDIWHQQNVLVDAAADNSTIYDDFNGDGIDFTGANVTQDTNTSVSLANGTDAGDFANTGAAGGFAADYTTENTGAAGGFAADYTTENTGAAGGFAADYSTENTGAADGFAADYSTENTGAAGGFAADYTNENTGAAGGFAVDYNNENAAGIGERHRETRAGGGSSVGWYSGAHLEQEKLDKIIAFKQKHSDHGPKTTGVQITLILRIPFAYIPEDLLGKYVSVVIQDHGVELVRSLRRQSMFYSYFKELNVIISEPVEELTMPPTNMPTTNAQLIAFQKEEALVESSTDRGIVTVSTMLSPSFTMYVFSNTMFFSCFTDDWI